MRKAMVLAAGLGVAAQGAMAEPPGGRAARAAVFPPDGVRVTITDQVAMSPADAEILTQVLAAQPYYGAVAMSPDEGLMSEALLAAANYHDVEAAKVAAMAGCNARKQAQSADCVIVAELRPEGWEPRPLQLSASATEALLSEYKGPGRKALAISPATGKWALGKGRNARQDAVADCEAAGGGGDCTVVVAD